MTWRHSQKTARHNILYYSYEAGTCFFICCSMTRCRQREVSNKNGNIYRVLDFHPQQHWDTPEQLPGPGWSWGLPYKQTYIYIYKSDASTYVCMYTDIYTIHLYKHSLCIMLVLQKRAVSSPLRTFNTSLRAPRQLETE